jgi:hypothetical protein
MKRDGGAAMGCVGAKRVHGSKGSPDEWETTGEKGNWGGERKGDR